MYDELEVATVLHNWVGFQSAKARKPFVLVRVIDVSRGLKILSRGELYWVLARGVHGEPLAVAAARNGLPRSTVHRRFWAAVKRITAYLNGEEHA